MKREIITTADGSKTISLPDINENYHSTHGALQEAMHVFIQSGYKLLAERGEDFKILEIGFGSGLNAVLTLREVSKSNLAIHYSGLEAFPINKEEQEALDYISLEDLSEFSSELNKMHDVESSDLTKVTAQFSFERIEKQLADWNAPSDKYNLVYFDAFGPRVQPELWTEEVFQKMYNLLKWNGVLVTYCAQGQMKRNMKAAGFQLEALPGPPGKREMTRGIKIHR